MTCSDQQESIVTKVRFFRNQGENEVGKMNLVGASPMESCENSRNTVCPVREKVLSVGWKGRTSGDFFFFLYYTTNRLFSYQCTRAPFEIRTLDELRISCSIEYTFASKWHIFSILPFGKKTFINNNDSKSFLVQRNNFAIITLHRRQIKVRVRIIRVK